MITNRIPGMGREDRNSLGNRNPSSFLFHLTISLIYLSLLAFTPGCGRNTGSQVTLIPIEGKVTLNGQPLDGALIRFQPTDKTKGPAGVVAVKAGAYSLDQKHGIPVGEFRAEISDVPTEGEPPPGQRLPPKAAPRIPERYQTHHSFVVRTVPGPNKQDFNLAAP